MSSDVPRAALPVDPIVIADELCELLSGPDQSPAQGRQLAALVHAAADCLDLVLAEVQRRGLLRRLVPAVDASDGGELLDYMVTRLRSAPLVGELATALIQRARADDRSYLELLLLRSQGAGLLPAIFASLIDGGLYEPLCGLLCRDEVRDSAALRALGQARPDYDYRALNQPALAALGQKRPPNGPSAAPYALLIVPGYTPNHAKSPVHLRDLDAARQRVELAAQDFLAGQSEYVLLSGGNVHPPGTPYNEALMMREYLLELGVSPDRILVDPHARHTTTNLRNAGRLMLAHGLSAGLIVTGFESALFSQAFYLGYPDLSTFLLRCEDELGYAVGELSAVDDHHITFTPAAACPTPTYNDPLDY